MQRFKLKLRRHELETLHSLFEAFALPIIRNPKNKEEQLVACLLSEIYLKLNKHTIYSKKANYSITLSAAEAIMFHLSWTRITIPNGMPAALINRIIGEVDRQFV